METKTLISLIFLLQAIINDVSLSLAQNPGLRQSFMCNNKRGDINDPNLVVERDVTFALHLQNIEDSHKFYFGTVTTHGSHNISIMSICPPDVKLQACHECANTTITYLKLKCPKQKEGVAWTASEKIFCMVRYADYPFQISLSGWAYATFPSPPNQSPSSPPELEKQLNNLANKLKEMVGKDSAKSYGSGSVTFGPGTRTLYGLMQCAYGTNKDECMKCLSDMTNRVHNCCSKQRSLSGISASTYCYFWYHHNNILPKTHTATVSYASLQT